MAFTLNRRLAQLVDSNGQLNAGKIPDNEITQAKLHSSFTVTASHLGTSLTPTFGNTTVGSRLTFSSNSHYLETGTNAVAIKSSGGNVYLNATNAGTVINNGLTVNSNITTTGYLAGPSTFTIDPAAVGDNTGTVVIAGNLQVDGTTTTINSTTLDVDDLNITVAKGAADSAAANGAGLTIEGPTNNATMTWDHANQYLEFNKDIFANSHIIGTTSTKVGRIINASGVFNVEAYSNRSISFGNVDNGEHVRIDANGKVGIGTTSPGALLDLSGVTASSPPKLRFTGTGEASAGDAIGQIDFHSGDTTDHTPGIMASIKAIAGPSGGEGHLQFLTDMPSEGAAAATVALHLHANGKVGIGTLSPSKKLSIHDNTAHQLQLHGGNSYWNIGAGWSGYYQDYLLFATSSGEKMVIDTNGNVGIGLNSPSAKLHIVNNSTSADAILLQSTEDSSSAAPILAFKRNSASVADADYLGQLKFKGENDADQEVVYAKITSKIQDASDGSEDGLIEFANKKAGSNVITARLRSDSLQLLNSTNLTVDGNIGIGQTNPTFKLDVTGTFRTTADAYFQNDIYVDDKIRHNGDVDNFIHFSAADTQSFVTNNLTRLTIASDGHILAASTFSAASKLSVGTNAAHGSYDLYNNGNSYFNGQVIVDDHLSITGSAAELTVAGNISMTAAADRRIFMGGQSGATFGIAYDSSNPNYGIFYTEASPDVVNISPNGSATAGSLRVLGNGQIEATGGNIYLTGSVDRRIKLSDSGVAGLSDSDNTVHIRANDDDLILNAAGNGKILFVENGDEHLRIDQNGYATFKHSGNDFGIQIRSEGTSRSGLVIDHPGTTTIMGSALVLASDDSYRLGTASNYHVRMMQNGDTYVGNSGTTRFLNDGDLRIGDGAITAGQDRPLFTGANASSYSTSTNLAYTKTTDPYPVAGEALKARVRARAYTKYIHMKTNLTSENVMFFFRIFGYFYNYGVNECVRGGYTYNGGVIQESIGTAYNTNSSYTIGDFYRSSSGGYLCLRLDVHQTGYTEGEAIVMFGSHSSTITRELQITDMQHRDDGNNAY